MIYESLRTRTYPKTIVAGATSADPGAGLAAVLEITPPAGTNVFLLGVNPSLASIVLELAAAIGTVTTAVPTTGRIYGPDTAAPTSTVTTGKGPAVAGKTIGPVIPADVWTLFPFPLMVNPRATYLYAMEVATVMTVSLMWVEDTGTVGRVGT